ncbi:MAG TPA: type II CAAX endopeptidase family protein [Candidatus Acidoferrales bacterium]|nr:type II CAAX endopeptidase family protein [Candidatus Acidoferrales bacterium]
MSSSPTSPPQPEAATATTQDRSRVAPVWHTVLFIAGTIGLALTQANQTERMSKMMIRTRVPLYSAMIIFELILLLYVWIGVWLAKKRLRDLIGGRWKCAADFWRDVGIAILFTIVVWGVLLVVGVLLGRNQAGLEAVRMLIPRTAPEMALWVALSVTAGFCEELIFRGYLQRQFFALTGKIEAAVALQACVFGAAHLYQGWKGALTITVYGALFGALAAWRRSLRPGMIQHAGQDTIVGLVGGFAVRHRMF